MRARRVSGIAVAAVVTSFALAGCASGSGAASKPFAQLSAVDMLPPTSVVDTVLHTTMVFTLVPTKSVQTKVGKQAVGECGDAITAFADAKSKDNAYEEMADASNADIQFNAVRYRSLAIAKTAIAAYRTIADACPHDTASGIGGFNPGIDGVSGWAAGGRLSAGFRVRDTIFYLNTSLSGPDTTKVLGAEVDYAQGLVKPG